MGDNVLTAIVPDLYKAAEIVGRESVGLVRGATMNSSDAAIAKDTTVKSIYVPDATAEDVVPGNVAPNPAPQALSVREMTLSTYRKSSFKWGDEEIARVNQGSRSQTGVYATLAGAQFEKAYRVLVNEIEQALAAELNVSCGLARGTAGTAPFGQPEAQGLEDAIGLRSLFNRQGSPRNGRRIVIDDMASTNLLGQKNYLAISSASDDRQVRTGDLSPVMGMSVGESFAIPEHRKVGANKAINKAGGYAVGDTDLVVDGGGAAPAAGDLVTIGDYTYGVASATGARIVLNTGLKEAVANDATVTVVGNHTKNFAFLTDVVEVAVRPDRRDKLAVDYTTVQDPVTGLSMAVSYYAGYKQESIEVSLLSAVKVWQPEFVLALLG